ncbi:hypothetical protein HXY33_05355 [Candidatus Bathyarchaeota archaeon]|nr:hypothetical protein [Candidatus Bathyarchaeota archaeon]
MRIRMLFLFLLLLAVSTFDVQHLVGVVADETEHLWTSYGLPDDVPREPMPENFTTQDFLNTTNPCADSNDVQGWLDEVDDIGSNHPLYVLVFGDEERERVYYVGDYIGPWMDWTGWAMLQIERGDEALAENFGIDIRILGFLEWDSNNGLQTMAGLRDELETETNQYLRQWYDGE